MIAMKTTKTGRRPGVCLSIRGKFLPGLLLAALALAACLSGKAATAVTHLRCEYRTDPLGLDAAAPRLSWRIDSDRRAVRQTAYQVLVASTPQLLARNRGDLWDSGKVASDRSVLVDYAGQPLPSRAQCHWKVRLWDQDAKMSAWSDRATWAMGLLTPEAWQARWIGAVAQSDPQSNAGDGVGYHAAEASREDETKWVQVDLGRPVAIESVVLHALNHGYADHPVKGFGFPIRFRIEGSDDADFPTAKVIVDHTSADYANPGHAPVPFAAGGVTARYVRVTATRLWNRRGGDRPYCFALAQLEVISAGKNVALKAKVTAQDSVETSEWASVNLTDGQRSSPQGGQPPRVEASVLKPSATVQLRKEFTVEKKIKRAVAYVCGLGFYELRLNGQKVGDRVLDPGWTNYRKTCLYTAYDVTAQLTRGQNAVGLMLGNGMYNVPGGRYVKFKGSFGPPKAIFQLYVEHTDGTSTVVVSDGSWAWAPSPVVFSCIYGGEDYDARKELPGWDKAGFSGRTFQPVCLVDGPGGRLSAQAAPPIKVMKEYKPAKITEPKPGVHDYDFGQNCASMPRLTVKGPAGASVRLTPGELLQKDGQVSQGSCGGPAYYTYTLKGGAAETWTPRFFYYGSRYVQVDTAGHPPGAAPQIVELSSQFVHSSAATVGTFACANPLVNRIHELIDAAIESNLQSVLTDCPHREKLGWLECSHLLAGCLMFNYDVPTFYAKIANDMSEAQLDNGMVPDIAPEYTVFGGGFRDSPEWGSACVITPWQVFQMYGDRSLLARHYDTMTRYVGYLQSTAKDHLVTHGLGDWYDIGPGGPGESKLTSKGLTATAIYYQDLVILKDTAALLGKTAEARQFEDRARAVKEAFNRKFFDAGSNHYDRNSQTANAMPLVLGLVPEERRGAVLAGLVTQIRAGGNRVTAGDVGFNYLVRALADGGRGDVLYDMLIRDDGPGYAYQLKQGATALTEAWDTNPGSSQNHCMLGHIEEWFYRGLGGLASDPAGPGFKRITVQPQIVGALTSANVAYDSAYGRIVSHWQRARGTLSLDVTIPPNTTATVYVPAKEAAGVTESGRPANRATGVQFLRLENQAAVYAVGSGTYRFQSTLPAPKATGGN
jgi:hypothetical protein